MHPVLFTLGPLRVYSYGLMVALGIITAVFLIQRRAAAWGLPAETIVVMIFRVIFCGLIGGRLFYVFLNKDFYFNAPLEVFKLYKGGLVFHGSFFLGLLCAVFFIKKHRLPFLKTMDVLALFLPLAHAFGRMGCFLNGCCYGRVTDLPWGVVFPGAVFPVHPVQLYAVFFLISIFSVLVLIGKRKQFDGQIISVYLILYGVVRFGLEFFRGDNPKLMFGLSLFQYISVIIFLSGVFLYRHAMSRKP
ncbi:MAG: prolipoprotein diacylglyceryl transferase [Candidatus Omnitrophica bacterium]|nr:prolipoprotein diacylglyceryl transferase [Candidatus Omnitrophota bacterium]MBU4478103.1 prolipoprotein diacylglyceryl transferase [Candidatus Omnitrophota bacterium]MCG2702926.1 prolipoprotein diacylglyceryl transferase [Candidatus Omnitrophota bacterium]